MKPFYHTILREPDESFTCREWHLKPMELPWYYFSEYLLKGIIRGRGMRCIGDAVGRFQEGDLVLIGPNTPMSWWSDRDKSRLATNHVTASFQENFLGAEFWQQPELGKIRRLLSTGRRSLIFSGRISGEIIGDMLKMTRLKGFERLSLLLSILNRLATASKPRFLTSVGFSPQLNEQDAGRLSAACKYIRESYEGEVWRDKAATLANFSPAGFSRFFHRHMGRTFDAYVTELRVSQACQKLVEQDATIADIAFSTGFNNLSNFNRHFQKLKGMTPREYRQLHTGS